MPETHPRPDKATEVQRSPLKIIKVYLPESPQSDAPWVEDQDKYTVALQLSREVTEYEAGALGEIVTGMVRVYGSTLEISNTTLEEIEANKPELVQIVTRMEEHGQSDREAAEAEQAEWEAVTAAEAERLRSLADRIKFDDIL